MEAILIKILQPSINNQCSGINRTIKLFTYDVANTAPAEPASFSLPILKHSYLTPSNFAPLPYCLTSVCVWVYQVTYPVTSHYCHNCTSKNLHHSSSYANCPNYTRTVLPKKKWNQILLRVFIQFTPLDDHLLVDLSRDNSHILPPWWWQRKSKRCRF